MWVKSLGLSPEFLLSLDSYSYKNVDMSFSLKELDSCSKVLANILEELAMIVTLYRNMTSSTSQHHLPEKTWQVF